MESFIDPWGESDSLLGDIASKGFYDENWSLCLWCYFATLAEENSMMIDVGAYSGLYSLFGAAFSKSCIAAIEASAFTYSRLVKNIYLNKFDIKIVAAHYAATSQEGDILFGHRYGVYTTCSGDGIIQDDLPIDHSEVVKGIPLDYLKKEPSLRPGVLASPSTHLHRCSRVHAIKIDVEGAEREVLLGATEILGKDRPFIIAEVLNEEKMKSVSTVLDRFKYEVKEIPGERNFLIIPAEKLSTLKGFDLFLQPFIEPKLSLERLITIRC